MVQKNYSPIDVNGLFSSFNHMKVKTLTKASFKFPLDKYNVILAGSIIFFLASVGFWCYVNFYLEKGL